VSDGGVTLVEPRRDADGGCRAEVVVAADAAWFAGHFPGEPVLPAVAQISLFDRLFRAAGGDGSLTALDSLRLTAQVRPGDRLAARLAARDDAGRRRAALEPLDGGRAVTSGVLAWSETGDEPAREATRDAVQAADLPGRGAAPATAFPDPAVVLPHQPPARLAERVLELWQGGIRCLGRVPADSAAVVDGEAGVWMALELAAQAAGLLQAATSLQAADLPAAAESPGEPRVGYVVRLRDARFRRPTLPAGAPLTARVELEGSGGPLSLYRARIELDGAVVARGSLATFVPPAFVPPAFVPPA